MTRDVVEATYKILAENESTLLKLVTRLNKKATKLAWPLPDGVW